MQAVNSVENLQRNIIMAALEIEWAKYQLQCCEWQATAVFP